MNKRQIWVWAVLLCIAIGAITVFQATGRYSVEAPDEGRTVLVIGVASVAVILFIVAKSKAK